MKRRLTWLIALLALAALSLGIVRAINARSNQQQRAQADAKALQVAPVYQLTDADVLTLRHETLTQTLELSGSIKAQRSATLKADVSGTIVAWQVRAGDAVKAGQVLGRIDAQDLQARLSQAQQQAAAQQAAAAIQQRQFEDSQRLAQSGFISASALRASQDSWHAAQANLKAAQANVQVAHKALGDSQVRAPFAGHIAQSLVDLGDRVGVNSPMAQLVDLSALEWQAQVSAEQLREVRIGQRALLRVAGLSDPVAAQVKRINPSLTPGSRNATLYLSLDAHPGLRDGDFAQGQLSVGTQASLAAPASAVRHDKPQPYVQLIDQGVVRHLTVTEGRIALVGNERYVEIQGPSVGQRILRSSAGAMAEGSAVKFKAFGS